MSSDLARRSAIRRALRTVERERDELREAARAWLRFDNDVEPPRGDDPYERHVAYEDAKFAITERVAAAIKAAEL